MSGKQDFRIFGRRKQVLEDGLLELEECSLCFTDPQELRRFGEFILKCAAGMETDPDWDHEHYLDFRSFAERFPDIAIARLDPRNVS